MMRNQQKIKVCFSSRQNEPLNGFVVFGISKMATTSYLDQSLHREFQDDR